MDDAPRRWLLFAGALAGYALLVAASPVRTSLRDGARCLRRYQQLWLLPAVFALTHGLFRLWVRWFESSAAPDGAPFFASWQGWQPPVWQEALGASWLAALENTAGLFNCLVDVFPLSAPAAGLFLCNWRGYQGTLARALRRRFGWAGGTGCHFALVVCAAAAAVKPALFGGLPRLNAFIGADQLLRAGELVNWLGFVFEYLLGVGLQIYLILLCFVWVRGLRFEFDGLRRFALRRLSFVLKWSAVILALGAVGINLPLAAASFQRAPEASDRDALDHRIAVARWVLALIILAGCAMQITLTFHNESLRLALADHVRLLRRHWARVGWLALVAFVHFFLLAACDSALRRALGAWTWPEMLWGFAARVLWALLAGWLLASWVCLFRRCEIGRPNLDALVRF